MTDPNSSGFLAQNFRFTWEQQVLAGCLADGSFAKAQAAALTVAAFHDPCHQIFFSAVQKLSAEDKAVTIESLAKAIEDDCGPGGWAGYAEFILASLDLSSGPQTPAAQSLAEG